MFDKVDQIARDRLLKDSLDRLPLDGADTGRHDPWVSFSRFATDGACVANVDVALLPIMEEGRAVPIAALRAVAVAAEWRGRGLFRASMETALAWCDTRAPTAILYAAEPGLYTKFGFHPVPQHAFVGPAPPPLGPPSARRLDPAAPDDRARIAHQVERRAPLSLQSALAIDATTFLRNLDDPDFSILYSDALDALIVAEAEADVVTLVDVVAATLPSLARILGTIGAAPRVVRTMFPPDRLDWSGRPDPEDTGLMARGTIPPAWARPFMIAPLSEF